MVTVVMENFIIEELLLQEIWIMNATLRNLKKKIGALNSRMDSFVPGADMGQTCPRNMKGAFFNLAVEVSEIEQYNFATDVEIYHMQERDNEDCVDVVLFIAAKLGVMVERRDVVRADRVGKFCRGITQARPMYVRFTTRAIRNQILAAARVNPEERPFKIYERMTALNRDLFYRTLKVARAKQFKYVWCKDGKIYTRKDTGTAKIRIRHTDDLSAMFDLYQNLGQI